MQHKAAAGTTPFLGGCFLFLRVSDSRTIEPHSADIFVDTNPRNTSSAVGAASLKINIGNSVIWKEIKLKSLIKVNAKEGIYPAASPLIRSLLLMAVNICFS